MSERDSAVNHEAPESIAERFVDGFMHPGLEHDAERLARAFLSLAEQHQELRRQVKQYGRIEDAADDLTRRAESLIAVVPTEWDGGDLGYLVGDLAGAAKEMRVALRAEEDARRQYLEDMRVWEERGGLRFGPPPVPPGSPEVA